MQWLWLIDGKTLCVDIEEDGAFGGPVWSRSKEKANKEEVECVLKASSLEVGTEAAELAGLKVKHMGVFVEVLRDRRKFMEFDQISIDNVDNV